MPFPQTEEALAEKKKKRKKNPVGLSVDALQSSPPHPHPGVLSSAALTCLLCGEEDDESDDDDEKQGDNGDEADLQGGPAWLLGRLGRGCLRHSRVSSFRR